jgi:hypothetical protein
MESIQIFPLCEEYARGYADGYDAGKKGEDAYAEGYAAGYAAADSKSFTKGALTVFWFFYRLFPKSPSGEAQA